MHAQDDIPSKIKGMATIYSVLVHFVMATDFHVEPQVHIYELKFRGGLRSICSLDKPDHVFSSKCIFSYSEHDEFTNEIKFYIRLVHRLVTLSSINAIF